MSSFKRWALIIIPLLMISACGPGSGAEEPRDGDPDSIRMQISQNKEQIAELNQEITMLEERLAQMGEVSNGRRRVMVTVEEVQMQSFANYFQINANVAAVNEASISPEVNGQIRRIEVARGQIVQPGQVVIRLNTSVIDSNIEEVRTSLQLAETVYERQKSLWDQEIGSEIQYLEARNNLNSLQTRLQTLQSQLDMAVIRSPIRGIVDDIFVKEGELAMPGLPLLHIINLDQLYINADVSESYLPSISRDDQVILRFPAFPEFVDTVDIHRLGNVINPENRTFRLQLRINNSEGRFKPNMVASIGIRSYFAEDAIVVPSILVKQDPQGHFVYVADPMEGNGMVARKAYIEREMNSEGNTMIRSGLSQGDLVIRQGHNQVTDGERIQLSGQENNATSRLNN